jgi:hypothetical protein
LRLTPVLVVRKLLLVVDKLGVSKFVDDVAEFNSAHSSVILAVPMRDIVTDEAEERARYILDVLR